jgi:hypothetical protein
MNRSGLGNGGPGSGYEQMVELDTLRNVELPVERPGLLLTSLDALVVVVVRYTPISQIARRLLAPDRVCLFEVRLSTRRRSPAPDDRRLVSSAKGGRSRWRQAASRKRPLNGYMMVNAIGRRTYDLARVNIPLRGRFGNRDVGHQATAPHKRRRLAPSLPTSLDRAPSCGRRPEAPFTCCGGPSQSGTGRIAAPWLRRTDLNGLPN